MSARTSIRLLILEDSEDDAELMVDALRQTGLDPRWERVETRQGFAAKLAEAPDLILADFGLAQFTGLEALEMVRGRGLDVPFILVSGSIGEDLAVSALHGGADDYLLKDRTARLGPAVLRALEKRRLRAQKEGAELALRESEERFREIAENIREVFWLIDLASGALLYVSPGFELVWGRPRSFLDRARQAWIATVHADDRGRLARAAAELPASGAYDLQYRILRPDGAVRWIHDRAFPVRNAAGAIYRVAGVAEDVTEQVQGEAKVRGLNRIHAMLSGINALIVRAASTEELFAGACRIAAEHGGFGIAWVGEIDAEGLRILPVAAAGLEEGSVLMRLPLALGAGEPTAATVQARAVDCGRPAYDNDITRDAAPGGERRREAIRRGFRSVIALPLTVDGKVVATFTVFARESGFFDEEEAGLLAELAGNISFALEHLDRKRRLEGLARVRALSGAINAAIVRIGDRDTLLRESCRIAAERGAFEMVWVGEIDPDRKSVRAVAWHGFSEPTANAVSWSSIEAAQGALSEAIRTRGAAVRNSIEASLPHGALRDEAVKAGCLSSVCLPVVVDNSVRALIVLFAARRNFFDAEELTLLNEMAADVSFALQSIASRERVEYLSYYDPLTGLPNRTLFIERAGQMRGRGDERPVLAFVLLNIERFRNINDTFGRHGGDELLRLVAKRLETAFGGAECLARVGADNFGILIRGVHEPALLVHAIEQRVLGCFTQPFLVGGAELRVAARAGVALHPADGENAETLFQNAEAALSRAGIAGERFLFYAAHMNAEAAQVVSLETRLRKAVEQGQFVLHYQSKLELGSGRVCGVEALIRWRDPESAALVPPGRFIPLLEETGMIFEVGRWAIAQALGDHRDWRRRGCAPERVAVNVSAVQLRRRDFVQAVGDAIAGAADADALELEVTESVLMHDVEANMRMLLVLRGMGIRVAIDDFGTGYSSLSYITRLPVSSIKIDRSFVHEMATSTEAQAIISTIVTLARALGLRTVAEGVETEDQARRLRSLRCDEAQGYFFARPMPAEDLVVFLESARGGGRPTRLGEQRT